jgi:uncharacterized protein YjaZ
VFYLVLIITLYKRQKHTYAVIQELISKSSKAFHTLIVLLEHKRRIVGKRVLLEEVWQDTFVKKSTYPKTFQQLKNFSLYSRAANSLSKLKKKVYNPQSKSLDFARSLPVNLIYR